MSRYEKPLTELTAILPTTYLLSEGYASNHSYIKGSDGPEGGDTPLAFMFALPELKRATTVQKAGSRQ